MWYWHDVRAARPARRFARCPVAIRHSLGAFGFDVPVTVMSPQATHDPSPVDDTRDPHDVPLAGLHRAQDVREHERAALVVDAYAERPLHVDRDAGRSRSTTSSPSAATSVPLSRAVGQPLVQPVTQTVASSRAATQGDDAHPPTP